MGGSKNKSPAQKDKSQNKDAEQKKSKKSEKSNVTKTTTSVLIDESRFHYFLVPNFLCKFMLLLHS